MNVAARFNALFILSIFTTLPFAAQARSWKAIQKSGTIIFATEGTFPPFNEFKGSKLTGFEVDVAQAIAREMGLKLEWKTFPFDALLIGLAQDRYDVVIASHGITEERLKAVDFTNPHYCTGGVIYAKEKGPLTAAALKGKKIAVQVGTTYLQHLQTMKIAADVKTYPKDTDSLQNLLAGRVDAWVTDRFVGLQGMKSHPDAHIREGETLFQERVAMAVAKGNAELATHLNDGLKKIQTAATYADLSKSYFGTDVRCP